MKAIIFSFLISLPCYSQIAILSGANGHVTCTNASCTTAAVNSTGASLIVAVTTGFSSGGDNLTPSSSPTACASWTKLPTCITTHGVRLQIWYCVNPTTSSSQTFTDGGNSDAELFVTLYSGTDTSASVIVDHNCGANFTPGTTSISTGSATPSGTGNLVVSGLSINGDSGTISVDSSLSIVDSKTIAGCCFSSADAYLVDSSTASINPTWSWVTANNDQAAVIAIFRPPAGSGSGQIGAFLPGP